jgi:hypothetical protein
MAPSDERQRKRFAALEFGWNASNGIYSRGGIYRQKH